MKKILLPIISFLLITTVLNSCKKDFANESYAPDVTVPVVPDLAVMVTTTVTGFIIDENNKPVFGASVAAGSKTSSTDEFGFFSIKNVSLSKTAGFVKVTKTGYFYGYKTFRSNAGGQSFVRLKLMPKINTGDADAATGGSAVTAGGAAVTLPANAVVTAGSGAAYSGIVHIAVRNVDPSDIDNAIQMPGDGRGTDNAGHLKQLQSYASIAVELTGSAGQLLQIANGKQATVKFPVAAAVASAAPATISLWSFNESNGLWKEESTAVKSGNFYTGTVSHFSFWDAAAGQNLVNFSVQVTDAALHPLANVPVMITLEGSPYNAGYGSFGYTDALGNVQGSVFANRNMILEVMTPCSIAAYTHNFTTTSANYDMGTITANLGQSAVTLTGTVKNCSNANVTDGYIQTYDNGFYNRISITNGTFSFAGIFCTNGPTSIVAVDNITHQQGTPQVITLTAGTNNLGTISACGTSTMGFINYTIDGVPHTLIEPTDTLGGYVSAPVNTWTQVVQLSSPQNGSPQFSFQFDGNTVIGSSHIVTEIFTGLFPGGRGVANPGLPINITEYGNPGGFITGSFSGNVVDFVPTPAPHTISCSFRIRRMN